MPVLSCRNRYTNAVSNDDILSATPAAPGQRVRYGPEPEHFADLYFAKDKRHAPLAINIHGGYWRARYDLGHASHFCAALAARGLNTANVEYRRVGSRGGGWPHTFEDVRAAYRYLTQSAAKLGIASGPVVVVGHSAGGQLALCLAAHESSLHRCISLAGVLDLRRAWQLHLSNDAVVDFLGGTPEQVPEHYREASPMELTISNARQVIVHGLADDVVPVSISQEYVAVKKKQGEQVEFIPIPKANHFDVIDPQSKAFATIVEAVLRLSRG
jgi:acetyl esterase/lipase